MPRQFQLTFQFISHLPLTNFRRLNYVCPGYELQLLVIIKFNLESLSGFSMDFGGGAIQSITHDPLSVKQLLNSSLDEVLNYSHCSLFLWLSEVGSMGRKI